MSFAFTEKMNEVSGYGGDYESMCRAGVCSGAQWFVEHGRTIPQFGASLYESGRIIALDAAGEALLKAIEAALFTREDGTREALREHLTPEMLQRILHHVLFIMHRGWNEYVEKMSAPLAIVPSDEETE